MRQDHRCFRWLIGVGLVVGLVGCGSVDRMTADDAGTGGAPVDTGVDAAAGTGGSETGGTGGAAGAAGSPGRPLGSGCTTDDQCGSGICDGATSVCCSGRADSCNTCVGGYLTPRADGTTCDTGGCDTTNTISTTYACKTGVCTPTAVNCQQHWCVGSNAPGEACPASTMNVCSPGNMSGATYCACIGLINPSTGTAYVLDSTCP